MRAGIDEQAFARVGAFEREVVRVTVTGLIVGTDRPDVEKDRPLRAVPDCEARVGEVAAATGVNIVIRLVDVRGKGVILKGRIIEEQQPAIGMSYPRGKFFHARQLGGKGVSKGLALDQLRDGLQ